MFERIVLATHGSSHVERALGYARGLALRDSAQVIVVHAFEPISGYPGAETKSDVGMTRSLSYAARISLLPSARSWSHLRSPLSSRAGCQALTSGP